VNTFLMAHQHKAIYYSAILKPASKSFIVGIHTS